MVTSGPGTCLEKPVDPLTYVRSIERALGVEESTKTSETVDLKAQFEKSMRGASADALRRALDALKKPKKE